MKIDDIYIINKFFIKAKVIKLIRGFSDDIFSYDERKYLENRYDDIFRSYRETLYRIRYNINEVPRCPICGDFRMFDGGHLNCYSGNIFRTTCGCKHCQYQLSSLTEKNNLQKKYGNPTYRNIEKAAETSLKKYGKRTFLQTEEFQMKSQATCMKRYGVKNVMKSLEIQ